MNDAHMVPATHAGPETHHAPSWAASLLVRHPGYRWNRDGNRIRCNGGDCAEIMDATPETVDGVFADHQARVLRPVLNQLETLRSMRLWMSRLVAEIPQDLVPAYVHANLDQVLVETGIAIRNGDAVCLDRRADEEQYNEIDAWPPVYSKPVAPEAVPVEPEPAAPEPEPEPVEPEPVAEPEPAAAVEPSPEPESKAAAPTVAALDWTGDLPEPEAARKPAKAPKVWQAPDVPDVFDESCRDALALVEAGSRISARFITPIDGDFTIEATLIPGTAGTTLVAGSMIVAASGKPGRYLHSLQVLALPDENEHTHNPSTEPEHFGPAA